MWFTRVSIANPVMATMVMLAFVVLGIFSYQRLSIDQFPNIDVPTVVVAMDYPGASPEIVESEVTKKLEEAINTVAGISALTSRSYEGTALVIVEFNLDVDGRKAAEDVREKVALVRPLLREEVKEPRISRFDPASQPVFNVAVLSPDGSKSAQELTNWASQVLQKRLENVRGVGAVSVVGGVKREINVYVRPAAMEAMGITVEQVVAALRSENQELPLGAIRSREQERVVQVNARLKTPAEFREVVVTRRNGVPVKLWQVADVVDGPQEIESLALYNGKRTVLLSVQKSQGENTIAVVDGLKKALADADKLAPPGMKTEINRDNSRSIRVSVANVQRTLIEGAVLTIGIVFLFLNSWRSTVITGLTLPIALIGTFLFMYAFGFTINTITLMALSLCVGLLIDDAIVVRENIVRHVQMGKSPHDAALAGTEEGGAGHHAVHRGGVPAHRLHGRHHRQVLPRVRRHHRGGGADLDVRQLHAGPHAVQRLARPAGAWPPHQAAGDPVRQDHRPRDGLVRHADEQDERGLPGGAGLVAEAQAQDAAGGRRHLRRELLRHPHPGRRVRAQGRFLGNLDQLLHAGRLVTGGARQVDAALREMPEVQYTVTTINSGFTQGKIYASVYVRLVDRKDRQRSVSEMAVPLREKLSRIPGITITNIGVTDLGGGKSLQFSVQGTDLGELERLSRQITAQMRQIPGLVDLDSTLKPDKPTLAVEVKRDAAADLGLNVNSVAGTLRTLVAGQTVGNWRASDGENYDIKVRLAPDSRDTAGDLSQLPLAVAAAADGSPRMVRLSQVATLTPSTGPNQINRRDMNREITFDANVLGRSTGEVSADLRTMLDQIAWPPGYRYAFGGSTKNMQDSFGYAIGALIRLHLHDPGQPVQELPAAAGADELAAAHADRRRAGAAAVRQHAEHVQHHRRGHADGPGDEERHPAGGLRDPLARGRHGTQRRAAACRAGAVAADPDDHAGHGLRHGAAGLRADRRLGATRADGPGGDRRRDHLVAAHAGGGAGDLLLPRRPGRLGAPPIR